MMGAGGEGDTFTPIPPEQARERLLQAVRERLGDDWDDARDGWIVVSAQDYMMRLTRGRVNVDFYVDLLGKVTVEEKEIEAGEDAGRLVAVTFLVLSLFIALVIARIAGYV